MDRPWRARASVWAPLSFHSQGRTDLPATRSAYFFLILFRAFLNESRPETWRDLGRTASYEDFVRQRPVFRTIEKELDEAGLDALTPLTQSAISSGTASNDEIADFVAHRSGRILSAYTVVKSDFFSGLQKMALPERVDGSPNFRRVPLSIAGSEAALRTPISTASAQAQQQSGPLVYGTGMPTVDGLRRALEKMGARDTLILWQSLREEPVVFVSGRPHVRCSWLTLSRRFGCGWRTRDGSSQC